MAISTSSSPAGDQVRTARSRFIPPLWEQVIAGIVIGLILGFAAPAFSEHIKVVGTAFIRLVEMVIIPLLFPLIVLSIARTGSARSTGRLAVKSLVYFEVVTTVILAITVLLALAAGLGHGANLHDAPVATTGGVQKSLPIQTILLNIIPDNIIGTLSTGNLLGMLFFAVLLGLTLGRTGTKAKPLLDVLDGLASAMFHIISWVIRFAPLAVIAFVSYNTAFYGWHLLLKLALFVVVFYIASAVVLGVIFPLVAYVFRAPYFSMLRTIGDLLLTGFVTRSSEVVLAPMVTRMEKFGVDERVASFTVPLGYAFNADGCTMYEGFAVVFIANAYGIDLSVGRLVTTMLVLMLLTKGFAGVPSSSIVILFSAAAAIGLPAQGIAVLLAVDFVVDMARTAINIAGNGLACVVIAKSEGIFRQEPAPETQPTQAQAAAQSARLPAGT